MTENINIPAKKKAYTSRVEATNAKHAAEKSAMDKRHELELQAIKRAFGSPEVLAGKDELH